MEYSSFFDSVDDDRLYDMTEFALFWKHFLSTGIYHTNGQPALRVLTTTGLVSKLETGSAFIEGFLYMNKADKLFTHPVANTTNARIDRIVIRLDLRLETRAVKAFLKPGVANTNPVPPELQRDEFVYEISVAQVRINAGATTISSIKDERLDSDVAGLVSSLITMPTEQFEEEWRRWFTGIQTGNPVMGGMTLSVGPTGPNTPILNDIWIDTR